MEKRIKQEHVRLLLMPSTLSASISIVLGLVLAMGATVVSLGKTGQLKQQLFAVSSVGQDLGGRYHSISRGLDSNHVVSQLLLWLFWVVVGFVAYLTAVSIARAIADAASLKESLEYVHAKPHHILAEAVQHLLVRLVCLGVGWLVVRVCFKAVLPYCLAVINGATRHFTFLAVLKILAVTAVLVFIGHVITIILRILMLRPRVFGYYGEPQQSAHALTD